MSKKVVRILRLLIELRYKYLFQFSIVIVERGSKLEVGENTKIIKSKIVVKNRHNLQIGNSCIIKKCTLSFYSDNGWRESSIGSNGNFNGVYLQAYGSFKCGDWNIFEQKSNTPMLTVFNGSLDIGHHNRFMNRFWIRYNANVRIGNYNNINERSWLRADEQITKSNKLRRLVWGVVWTCFARPFPRSMAMGWKRMLLRAFGAKIASTAVVYATARVFQPWLLIMDDYACLADGVDCYNAAPIHIGRNATVSQRAFLCTAGHNIMDPHHHQIDAPIVIEEQAWVCAEAFVIQGVTVGQGAVCAARAVVIKDVEPWTVVGGNPAKFIKKRVLINVSGGVNPYLLFYIISRLDAA